MTIKSVPFMVDGVMFKKCTMCDCVDEYSTFVVNCKNLKNGIKVWGYCRKCRREYRQKWLSVNGNKERLRGFQREWSQTNKVYWRERMLRNKYGLTEAEYDDISNNQGGVCKICGGKNNSTGTEKRLVVDHDHLSGKVRGLLCDRCNQGIGLLQESETVLVSAIDYLRNSK